VASRFAGFRQYLKQTRFDTAQVVVSAPFLIMVAFGLLNLSGSLEGSAPMYDTPLYPTTAQMLSGIGGAYAWLLLIIVMFYAGELVWRERDAKLDGVIDAFPVPNWVPLASKASALVAVVVIFLAVAALWCMGYQLLDGTVALEPLLYLKGLAVLGVGFVLLGWLSLAFQVYANHKFVGYLLTIGIIVSQMVLAALDFDHNLVAFAGTPATPYSDMNGYGHFLVGWGWFSLHWTLFTLAALVLAAPLWVRGTPEPWRRRAGIALSQAQERAGRAVRGVAAGHHRQWRVDHLQHHGAQSLPGQRHRTRRAGRLRKCLAWRGRSRAAAHPGRRCARRHLPRRAPGADRRPLRHA
jgi:ABC-2 type transport system permease protein